MHISQLEDVNFNKIENFFYEDHASKLIEPYLNKFIKKMRYHILFNAFFIILALTEIILFAVFFPLLSQSSILAFGLAFIFLTIFAFFTLRIYLLDKKEEQYERIKREYTVYCKKIFQYQEEVAEHYIALSNAYSKFADALHFKEYRFYSLPKWLFFLIPALEKFSCWCHWQDVYRMRESLLEASVEENIKLVKTEPTNLEVHISLANAYVMLSALYTHPRKNEGYEDSKWIPMEKHEVEMELKFRNAAERAIEEFKILKDYAPNDPWVHIQLAYTYHDLKMPKEEINEYETILKLNPEDKETLFKLGVLYFQQGFNAQGLKIYEELKKVHYLKAEQLIHYYGYNN